MRARTLRGYAALVTYGCGVDGRRIRVAHVITRMIVGGAQETVLLAAALADRERFDPLLVCGPQTGPEGSLHDEVRRRGIELVVLPDLVREVHPWHDARAVPALTRLFRERAVDVVHTNSSKAGIVGRAAARRARVGTVVHTVHGWPFHDHQPSPVAAVWRSVERRMAPLTDHLVVVAEADRSKGLAAGVGTAAQYVTVRSSLELSRYDARRPLRDEVRAELGLPLDAPVLGAVKRLSDQKDPLSLLSAFAAVRAGAPGARLLLVGDGPLDGAVRRAVAGLGLQEAVTMTGLRSDVPRLLQAVDVFVSTSLWEGLPRTIIEAMATGLPVVATPADGVVDVLVDGQTGRLVVPGDPAAVAAAILDLLREPEVALRLGEAGRERVQEFDAFRMTRALELLYAGGR
jgi:glycosyltransferase involved in cell wall biosynthesis